MKQRNFSRLVFFAVMIFILPVAAFISSSYSSNAEIPRTGQTTSYHTGDDGDLEFGAAWPKTGNMGTGRFNDNGDGTVTDLLTGLMWTKNANLIRPLVANPTYENLNNYVNGAFNAGPGYAGHTDWRIPNMLELESLTHAGQVNSSAWLNSQGFENVQAAAYWVSNAYSGLADNGWALNLGSDTSNYMICKPTAGCGESTWWTPPATNVYVWTVRGGQGGPANLPSDPAFPANIRKTGQTISYWSRDDGDLEWGVDWSTTTRFTNNFDGSISDNLTGLMWTQSGNLQFDMDTEGKTRSVEDALRFIDDMNSQTGRCIKPHSVQDCAATWDSVRKISIPPTQICTDPLLPVCMVISGVEQCRSKGDISCTADADCNSANGETCVFIPNEGHTDWRLPNKKEMLSLTHWEDEYSTDDLAVAGFSILNYGWCSHWTSTTYAADTSKIYGIVLQFAGGHVIAASATVPASNNCGGEGSYYPNYFWPVRGGIAYIPPVNEDSDSDGHDKCLAGQNPLISNCDCNDNDPAVHPGAAEVCNGIDDNCDGNVDEGFANADSDDYAVCAGDCDDNNPAVHPGAAEVCNGIDDNCDGIVDGGADPDGDGISSVCDNCPNTYNPDQAESDGSIPGMRGYWKFDEAMGFVAYDTVVNNNGTIYNATWGTGQVNGALAFKGGTDNTVTVVDDSGNMKITGKNISIEVWAYGNEHIDDYGGEWATIGIKSSYRYPHWYDDGYGLYYYDDKISFFINHYDYNKGWAPFTKNEWHHLAGTYDGQFIRVYVDGQEGTAYPYSENIVDALAPDRFLISGT